MRSNRAAPRGRSTVCGSAPDVIQYPYTPSNFYECDEINGSLTELQRLRNVRVNLCSPQKLGAHKSQGVEGAGSERSGDRSRGHHDDLVLSPAPPMRGMEQWANRASRPGPADKIALPSGPGAGGANNLDLTIGLDALAHDRHAEIGRQPRHAAQQRQRPV